MAAPAYIGIVDFAEFAFRAEGLVFGNSYSIAPSRPRLVDRQNPMELYDDGEFSLRYRFSKATVLRLLELLPLRENSDGRGSPLPPLLQLLIALRFYGAGTFQRVTGDLVNVAQSSVCRTIGKVTDMIAELYSQFVTFPSDDMMNGVMRDFYDIGRFPGVTGCIDCTHVRLKSPGGDVAEVFRNRKGVFSINVQAVTGPQLQFFDVVASWPGSVHDSRIFDNSRIRTLYEERRVRGILLGDQGYACRTFLMTPFQDPGPPGTPKYKYNKAHIRTRNSVERAFGVWKRRFPCLDMKLQHKPERVVSIITACAVLHNLGRRLQDPCPPYQPVPPTPEPRGTGTRPEHSPSHTTSGLQARDRLIARSFS